MRLVKICGHELTVKFTLRSLKVYEKLTGRNLLLENYMDIISLSLGADALLAFVYCSLQVEPGKNPAITLEQMEVGLGIDQQLFNEVVEAYIDFIPGLSKIREKLLEDPDFRKKLEEAGNDPEKIRAIFLESVPNTKSQPVQ